MTILCYHTVGPGWDSDLSVTTRDFSAQCRWLQARRKVVPLSAALTSVDRYGRVGRGMIAVTFDDGLTGIYDHAFEHLLQREIPATVFVVAGTLTGDAQADWVDDAPPGGLTTLTREQILELHQAGITFGSHTLTHPDLTAIDERECETELEQSKTILEDLLSEKVDVLAYPRGLHNERVRAIAQRTGYTHAVGTSRTASKGRFGIPRVGIYRGEGVGDLRIKDSRWYLRLRTGRLYRSVKAQRTRDEDR